MGHWLFGRWRTTTMMLLLCLVAVAAAVPIENARTKTRYDNYQVLSLEPQTLLHKKYLMSLGDDLELDFWKEGPETHIMVTPGRLEMFKMQLTKRRIPFSVHIENVQDLVDAEQKELAKNKRAWDYNQYNTLADTMAEIARLAANCPSGCSCGTYDIGNSVEGRPLTVLSISCGSGRDAVWIDADIHAREWLAPATVFKFIDRIWNGDSLRDTYDFYFLPMMNPDGYLYSWDNSRMWRKNRGINAGSSCIGTDLNRNYATNWGISGASTLPCSDTYRGDSPGSEPETAAVQDESERLTLAAFVSVHTYGEYWLHPWGHSVGGSCVLADDHADMYAVAVAAADAAGNAESDSRHWLRGNSCATIYPASGLTIEYAKDPGGTKYSFTPELRGGSFAPPVSSIGPSDSEFYAAIVAQMAAIESAKKK